LPVAQVEQPVTALPVQSVATTAWHVMPAPFEVFAPSLGVAGQFVTLQMFALAPQLAFPGQKPFVLASLKHVVAVHATHALAVAEGVAGAFSFIAHEAQLSTHVLPPALSQYLFPNAKQVASVTSAHILFEAERVSTVPAVVAPSLPSLILSHAGFTSVARAPTRARRSNAHFMLQNT
jgi:hypothetical protein